MKKISRFILSTAVIIITAASSGCSKTDSGSSGHKGKTDLDKVSFDWQEIYENKLSEFKNSEEYSEDSAFDIFDITGDGYPELLISPNSGGATPCHIYTAVSGEASDLGTVGNCGKLQYLPETKMIRDEYVGEGFVLGKYLSYTDGAFKTVVTYSDNSSSASLGAVIVHEINGEEVGLPEYEAAIEPYSSASPIDAGRRFSFGSNAVNYGIYCSESWQETLSSDQRKLCRSQLSSILELTAGDGTDPAFDLCDLNGDKIPELIVSDGSNPEATCTVYYFSGEDLVQMDGVYGYAGVVSFDTSAYVFFSGDDENKTYWSIANAGFSASDYTESDSIISIGRRHLLTEDIITSVF